MTLEILFPSESGGDAYDRRARLLICRCADAVMREPADCERFMKNEGVVLIDVRAADDAEHLAKFAVDGRCTPGGAAKVRTALASLPGLAVAGERT